MSSIIKAIQVNKTEIIKTLRLIFLGENSLSKELEEQLWELALNGFPRALINCRYDSKEGECMYDSLIKLKDTFIEIRNMPGAEFNSLLIKIAIKYIEKLIKDSTLNDFIVLCESNKDYFVRINNDCINIIRKEKTEEIKGDLIMSFAKIFKQIANNSMQINNLKDSMIALAIALRISIKVGEKMYRAETPKYVVYDNLNYHNEVLEI